MTSVQNIRSSCGLHEPAPPLAPLGFLREQRPADAAMARRESNEAAKQRMGCLD